MAQNKNDKNILFGVTRLYVYYLKVILTYSTNQRGNENLNRALQSPGSYLLVFIAFSIIFCSAGTNGTAMWCQRLNLGPKIKLGSLCMQACKPYC